MNGREILPFHRKVLKYFYSSGRHNLPWRKTRDPYRILVSEVMLQQTQVHRVIPKYRKFLQVFPDIQDLAKSRLADVLRVWSGLGYNRRAKYLRDAAIAIIEKYSGKVPDDYESLRELPGIGDYTAHAIRVFAFNKPDVFIETNIRTAFIQHFFFGVPCVFDREIKEQAIRVAEGQNLREWHWALMDYGAHLKRSGIRNNHRSAHYVEQSKFEGSLRQLRNVILRELSRGDSISGLRNPNITNITNLGFVNPNMKMFRKALASLARDGLVVREGGMWRIA